MSAAAVTASLRPAAARHARLPVLAVRLVSFAALALFAALHWARLTAPAAGWRLAGCVVIAVCVVAAVHASDRLGRRARAVALAATAAGVLAAVLLVAGVPLRLLANPRHWGTVASGLGDAIGSLPSIGVPYRGLDPWVRIVLVAGGGLLLALAGALTVRSLRRGRRPLGAALTLTAVYAVPAIEYAPGRPYAWGVVLTLLLGAFLWGDRVERGQAAGAAVFVAIALGAGLLVAPRVDASDPWIDYRALVESLSDAPSVTFDWNHGYGPLQWPRDNRVMLRVSSDRPRYWKAVDLDTFDGERWIVGGQALRVDATEFAPNHADWKVRLRFDVRDLRTPYYVTAGSGLSVRHSPRFALPSSPGLFATGREPLRRGDSYEAEAYVPDPTLRELRNAGTDYPLLVKPYLTMDLPGGVRGPAITASRAPSTLGPLELEFPQFSVLSGRIPPTAVDAIGGRYVNGSPMLSRSAYAPMWALAQRLRERASSPYDYVQSVQALLSRGFVYSERPPRPRPGRPPLVSFLFDTKEGYCQQFSGAMALLLRMGGVPARVSSGFSPGQYDDAAKQWVVRDEDAHSWVEAYFPGIGWVTFDPTPGVAPAHTQLVTGPIPKGTKEIPLRPDERRADVPARSGSGRSGLPGEQRPLSPWIGVLAALLGAGAVAGVAVLTTRARAARGASGELAELERALRVTGRSVDPPLTLQTLEQRFRAHAPQAAAYVAAVRLARFGGRPERPTPEQRAALRSELAAGLGWSGRLRAWWALPPRRRTP